MSQENKKSKAPKVKAILKKYGLKGSLSVSNHSTIVLTVREGPIDFITPYNEQGRKDWEKKGWGNWHNVDNIDVNTYWYKDHFDGIALEFLSEVIPVLNEGNHDNSDSMADYFDVGWYVDVNIGRWDQPYKLTK